MKRGEINTMETTKNKVQEKVLIEVKNLISRRRNVK